MFCGFVSCINCIDKYKMNWIELKIKHHRMNYKIYLIMKRLMEWSSNILVFSNIDIDGELLKGEKWYGSELRINYIL